jgi:hypothetical protein
MPKKHDVQCIMNRVAVTFLKVPNLSSSKSGKAHRHKSWGIKYGELGHQVI